MKRTSPVSVSAASLKEQEAYVARVEALNELFFAEKGRQRLAFLHSFGCQQNVADGEYLAGQLSRMGFGFTDKREEADLILFNTCAVREHAELKVFGNVGELKRLKKENPDKIIGLCGCMTQQKDVVERIQKSYPFVDLLFGTGAVHRMPEFILGVMDGQGRLADFSDATVEIVEGLPVHRTDALKASVSIMYGCNNFCTYCIVPYVRGRERSRESRAILAEIGHLVEGGTREITLLGQNVNSYGTDKEDELRFPELLRAIEEIPGEFRVRFMTSHPKDATSKLLEAMADCVKVAKHLHLPVQSGSDRILKKMNRGYTREAYEKTVAYARKLMPEITFTSDILLGFPGETEEDFQDTLSLIKRVRYSALYTFIYSKRSGTPAAEMDDPTLHAEKADRMKRLLKVQDEIGREIGRAGIGKVQRVLAEEIGEDGRLRGKNDALFQCVFEGDQSLLGTFVEVIPTRLDSWTYTATLLDD